MRPETTLRAIAELQAAGVEPEIWKVEGLDRREDYERVTEQARSAGREGGAWHPSRPWSQRRQARALVAAGGRRAGFHRLCNWANDLAAGTEGLAWLGV
jgi:hypothetical protein